ncbi:MAG: M1 family metallopeptidase [Candidatus Aminicenantes bacterium]
MKTKFLFSEFFLLFSCLLVTCPEILLAQQRISNVKYEIWVELDHQNRMLYGKEDIFWHNKTSHEAKDMWFHLYFNAFKNEKSTMFQESREEWFEPLQVKLKKGQWGWVDVTQIRLADGTDLKPTMEYITQDKPVHPGDQTVMRVLLPQSVKPGEEIHLKLEFRSKIPRGILRTGYYQDSYFLAQWFPKPGVYEEDGNWNCHEYHLSSEFYADFADFTVHITVPENFVVGASGKKTEVAAEEKRGTVTYTFYQHNIHDFAWTADPDLIKVERDFIASQEVTSQEYQEISHKLQLPLEEVKLPDVKMILLIEPEHKGQIDRHFKALKTAIKYYGLWYGPYPYETITMVDPPFRTGSGGMEYPTLFTAGTSILTSRDILSPESVIIHEFGHNYWYGLCANNEFEEAWLDEGINTYSTGKVKAKGYGQGVFPLFPTRFNRIPLTWFLEFPKGLDYQSDRAAGIHVAELDPINIFSWKFYNRGSYGLNVYMRASTCLYTLERLVGPETMLRILRTFQMRFRYKHPHTQDFIDVVNEVTGKDFQWFFEELFFKTLKFDYGISGLTSMEKKKHARGIFDSGKKKVEFTKQKIRKMEEKQKSDDEEKQYITEVRLRRYGEAKLGGNVPVKLKVVFEDGSQEVRHWRGQKRWKKYTFIKTAKARYAQIDPENIWLIDSNLSNNSLKRKSSRKGILKLTSKLLFWVQNYLQFLAAWS